MGLFGRGKRDVETKFYARPRAETAPDGWVAALALVDTCEAEQTKTRVGRDWSNNTHWVYDTRATYLVFDQHGALLPIAVEAKVDDVPEQGARLMIAYDPSNPTEVVVLLSEEEYRQRLEDYVRGVVERGVEAPCQVLAVTATGRVSRPKAIKPRKGPDGPTPDPAPEVHLTLRVTPPGGAPFDVQRFLWDNGLNLAPGTVGTFFYLPAEAASGYPVFPKAQHRSAGGDPVQVAREDFLAGYAGQVLMAAPGLTISRRPVDLDA